MSAARDERSGFAVAAPTSTSGPFEPARDREPGSRTNDAADLAALLDAVAAGRYLPSDGTVTVLTQPSKRDAGVISLTGRAVVFADTDPDWIAAQLTPGDFSAPLSAHFLAAVSERLGRLSHGIDMLTCAAALPGPPSGLPLAELVPTTGGPTHPRVARALRYRDNVRVWETPGGVLILGRGVAGRLEVAVEVDPECRGRGLGARLAAAARQLVPVGTTLWAQIAPANAVSVRAFLRAGFRPVGAEALLRPERQA